MTTKIKTKTNMQIIQIPERENRDYGEEAMTENIILRIFPC